MKKRFKTAYDERKRNGLKFVDEDGEALLGKTEQNHKKMCDVNNIIRQYDRSGLITHVNNAIKNYGDYTDINEYQESLNMVIDAQEAFEALPSNVRKDFANDPGLFFEFATNPENKQKMEQYGLIEKERIIEPIKVQLEEKIVTPE